MDMLIWRKLRGEIASMIMARKLIEKYDKIILYGDLRCCKDFAYIFDKVTPLCSIYGENRQREIEKYVSLNLCVVICSFDKDKCSRELEECGLIFEENYFYADTFFRTLDYPLIGKIRSRKVYIWGAGQMARETLDLLNGISIEGFIDSDTNKRGAEIEGIRILCPDEIRKISSEIFIVVSSLKYYFSIRKILHEWGMRENDDFVRVELLQNKPSVWLSKTFYDDSFYDFCCETFFRVFEVETGGNVSCCCTTLISGRIGNLLYEEYDEIWNSIYHKIQCLSVCNRTFTFCLKNACPALIQRKRQSVTDLLIAEVEYKQFIGKPEYLHISIDETCNLFCGSCRECIRISKGEELEKTIILKEKILRDADKGIKSYFLAGNGEIFLSKTYEEIWKSSIINSAKTVRILSNGMLFTQKKWEEFYKGKENVNIWVYISIDAATKETYEQIRRGGKFEVLLNNLRFISELRKNNVIGYFRINFVVQRKNYKEMEKFIELGIELGVDNVFFTKILNWGTYSDEEFDKISMMERDMQAPKKELKEILDKEIFKNKIVDLGTIQYTRNRRLPDYVDNYYEWETRDWIEMNRGK